MEGSETRKLSRCDERLFTSIAKALCKGTVRVADICVVSEVRSDQQSGQSQRNWANFGGTHR
jgi:hypothetical protein